MACGVATMQQRVAVGRRARDRLQREIAAGARPVVDHHRLAEPLRQRLPDEPRDDVGRAAGGNENDQGHRPRRISLRRIGCARAAREIAGSAAALVARRKNLRREVSRSRSQSNSSGHHRLPASCMDRESAIGPRRTAHADHVCTRRKQRCERCSRSNPAGPAQMHDTLSWFKARANTSHPPRGIQPPGGRAPSSTIFVPKTIETIL